MTLTATLTNSRRDRTSPQALRASEKLSGIERAARRFELVNVNVAVNGSNRNY
ncbi:MAG: hypothetical protein WCJ30_00810 [Deltaproteobacteria bacterium]